MRRTISVQPRIYGTIASCAYWLRPATGEPAINDVVSDDIGGKLKNPCERCADGPTTGDLWHLEGRKLMQKLDDIDAASKRSDIPGFRPGDTVKVHVKVVEGTRSRVQVFQGAVIARHGSGIRETFTVRKVSFGVGVERTFPVHSPVIDKIEVSSRGVVRRAKLYYLRDRVGKAAKIKEKR